MNEELEKFVKNMGLLCEQWTIIYRSFISQGLSEQEALLHTQAFMATILKDIRRDTKTTD